MGESSADGIEDGARDGTGHRAFWADEIADEIEARDPEEPVVVKGGVSPSGVPHIGHLNEVLRGYFVAAVLRERGHEVRQVFTSDDRDPLRKVPRKLADAGWNLVGLGEVDAGALGRNLGAPYTGIPDPFGCHDSYGAHFAALLADAAELVGVPVETVSNTDLYESGGMDGVVKKTLGNRARAREVLAKYQDKVDAEYVPFRPICANCGHVTETDAVTAIDLDAGTVEYVCTDVEAGDRTIEGCGHEGEAAFSAGKLPWRFEWPAQWEVLGVDFEPFGKDHAEGSWPSGREIAREVLGNEPPVPMVYEWFTLNGDALSSSAGNVLTPPELLDLVEPEVVRYFFALNPEKQRDLDLSRLDRLVEEFDRFERAYFEGTDEFAERAYPFTVEAVESERVRLPYTFAAVLGMTDDRELRVRMARNEGHIPADASDEQIARAMERVEKARNWAKRLDNEYNYRIQTTLPAVEFDADTESALEELADFVETGADGEAIQGEIYETAKRNDIEVGDFFAAGYGLFFGQDSGPQLGPLLGSLDREFVVRRLRREG
jgi:lysyl-tRNA synthetase class 1